MARPIVSVVIPVRNVADTIVAQLEALAAQDYEGPWEVLVADNGSTDETLTLVEQFSNRLPILRIVDASGRRGVNHARNAGARAARGQHLLFCDGDDVVDRRWVTELSDALLRYEAAGGAMILLGSQGPRTAEARLPYMLTQRSFLPSPLGANCAVRRQVWEALGGFDEAFDGGSGDEVEFFWRLQLAGYGLGSAPAAVVTYRGQSTLRSYARKQYAVARERARLHTRFAADGHPKRPLAAALRPWGSLIRRAPEACVSKRARWQWVGTASRAFGSIAGSIRYRTFLL